MRIKYNEDWYKVGDEITIPINYYIGWFKLTIKRKHKVSSIHLDACAICKRKNKTIVITGSVKCEKNYKLFKRKETIKKVLKNER